MEVKICKEIRDYTESLFFGLSMRQFIFSLLACGSAIGLYFIFRTHLPMEIVSWACILGAAPFAALGFIRYHGMSAEQLLWAWLKSEVIIPHTLPFFSCNYYFEWVTHPMIEEKKARKKQKAHRKIVARN